MSAHRLQSERRNARIGRRLALIIGVAIAVTAATSGIAFAYWGSRGAGTGSAATGTMTIQVDAIQGADVNGASLVPGGTGDVIVRVTNPNSFDVHVTAISGNGTPTASTGCTPTGVTFTPPTDYSAPNFTLTAGAATLYRLVGAASMNLSSASNCQGATFTIPVSVTVEK
jgi:hypothetical protein